MRKLPLPADTLESRLMLSEQIVMALPAHHPEARQPVVDLRNFADEDFVFTPQALGSGYHGQLIALCESAGFHPQDRPGGRADPHPGRAGGLRLRCRSGTRIDRLLEPA